MLLLQLERINEDKTGIALANGDSLSYTFSNAQVLQKIASEMKYDILLGRVIDYLINVWREHN